GGQGVELDLHRPGPPLVPGLSLVRPRHSVLRQALGATGSGATEMTVRDPGGVPLAASATPRTASVRSLWGWQAEGVEESVCSDRTRGVHSRGWSSRDLP